MALRTIQINGFKSFATDTKIHFYHPVTAIVGPNGSGKSNVADAIRFALGEQSMKSLRGGKGEDLIFNGSSKVPRKNRAHVSLLFDNSNKIFDIDATEVELERLVHRDGVNEYIINSNKTRLKDKQELIASANIGPTGHHLITQGEADKFVTATDQERRLLIEDALGLNLFKLRRHEAELKLSKTEDKLKEVSKHIWELEPVVKSLSNEVERLDNLKNKEGTLVSLYAEMFYLWQKVIAERELRYETESDDLKNEKSKLQVLIKDLEEKASETQDLSSEEIELGSQIKDQKKLLDEKNRMINDLATEIGSIDGQVMQLETRRNNLSKEFEGTKKANTSVVDIPIDRVEHLHNQVQGAVSLQGAKQAESQFYKDFGGIDSFETVSNVDRLEQELDEVVSTIDELITKKNEKQIKKRALEHELSTISESITKLERLSREAARDRLDSVRELEKARSRMEQTLAKQQELKENIEALSQDQKNFTERKHAVSMIYGADAIEVPQISLSAGEDMADRLRETKRQVLRLEAQLEDADISSLDSLRNDLEIEAARLHHLQTERYDVDTSLQKTRDLIQELTNQIETKIEVGLAEVNKNLERFFRVLFGGGNCLLKSTSDNGKLGVRIELQLPYKRIKSVHALSGGERSLASLAILFGITLLSPPPFVVLDETDAALDEANSRRYAKLIRELSEHTQLILITHNRETMTFADELYGVTMGSDGVSRLLSVTLKQGEALAKN